MKSTIYWEALKEIKGVTPFIFRRFLNYFEDPHYILYEATKHELLGVLDGVRKTQKGRIVEGIQAYRKNPREDFLDKRLSMAKARG